MKTKKKPVKTVDPRKYVAFLAKVGRTEKGIVHGYVTIDGDLAYVRKNESSASADIVPAAGVFNTEKEAQDYLAGEGVRRWVVGTLRQSRRHGCPVLFEAKVVHYYYKGSYKTYYKQAVKRISDGEIVELLNFQSFSTKKAAESHFSKAWHAEHKDLMRDLEGHKKHLAELLKNKPRSRKAAA